MGEVLGFVLALCITAGAIPVLARLAPGWGLVAQSGPRMQHQGSIPTVGGLAMGIAFLAAYVLTGLAAGLSTLLAVAVALILAGGVLDDRHALRSLPKFAFQIAAAALLALTGDALLSHLGQLMSPALFTLGRWAAPLSIFALVGVMNAMNMADGLDGLAGALALAACISFGAAASFAGRGQEFAVICIAAGATLAFLYFNAHLPWRHRAAVFMGDTGSLLLGLLLGWFAVRLAMGERPALAPITAVWILALPIADTVTLLVRRTLHGRNPFHADRHHMHHILIALGLSSARTTALLFWIALSLGAGALVADRLGVPQYLMFYLYMTGLIGWGLAAEALCKRLKLKAD
jgi:UDP-GlcNAc:undecaprenyl-phosphate/decaprenyl-phosphate GlcNAc-1-phosphate transferase